MSDIKISDMQPWVGAVTGNVEFPAVFGNENYRIALSQLTTSTFGFGSMALQNSNAVNITGGNVAVTALSGAITIANGGTGLGDTPTNGQLLIGNGAGYTLATLTAGLGIDITNSSGGITISVDGGGVGSVTSVDVSGGTTGLIFSGGPITTSGTITMSGTLDVDNGGTGATTASGARASLGAAASGANSDITSISGLTTPLSVVQGGTGANDSLSGYIFGNGTNPFTSVAAIPMSDLTGTLPINKGGTNATTVVGARSNILPSYAGNGGKALFVNSGATDVEWQPVAGAGTVTSVDVSGGTTGLTTSGGPIVAAGTITLGGTLAVANGGTGGTDAATARTNLSAAKSGANTDITSVALTSGTVSAVPSSANDIANKTYVDGLVTSGISYHAPVKYEVPNSTGNLTAAYNNGASGVGATLTNTGTLAAFAPDGPTAQVGDRILIYNQTNAFENGVYEVTTVGSGSVAWVLTRTADADSYGLKDPNALGNGDAFFVTSGNTGAGETYVCNTPGTINFGTTNISFTQVSSAQVYSAGTGLTLSGTTFSITNTGVTAASYGSASSVPVIAVNAQGQITSASSSSISIAASQITSGVLATANGGTGLSNFTSGGAVYATSTSALTTGTLPVTAGGTGVTTFSSGYLLKGAGTGAITTSVVYDNGTNVGIGTSSPGYKLDVTGSARVTSTLGVGGAPNSYGVVQVAGDSTDIYSSQVSIRGTTDRNKLLLVGVNTTGNYGSIQAFQDGTGALPLALNPSGGNVGIGGTPSTKLDVAATGGMMRVGGASGNNLVQAYTGSVGLGLWAGGSSRIYSGGGITFSINGTLGTSAPTGYTDAAVLTGEGRFLIGTTTGVGNDFTSIRFNSSTTYSQGLNMVDSNASASGTIFQVFRKSDDTNLGLIRRSSTDNALFVGGNSYLALGSGDTERMRIDSSGNVGIGTSSPAYKLDVVAADTTADLGYALRLRHNTTASAATIQFTDDPVTVQYAVITSNTSEFTLRSGSTRPFTVWTNGSERLRIGPAGQIGLSGANYGTSGQVLTSNGSGSAPTWQNASGGLSRAQVTAISMILGF